MWKKCLRKIVESLNIVYVLRWRTVTLEYETSLLIAALVCCHTYRMGRNIWWFLKWNNQGKNSSSLLTLIDMFINEWRIDWIRQHLKTYSCKIRWVRTDTELSRDRGWVTGHPSYPSPSSDKNCGYEPVSSLGVKCHTTGSDDGVGSSEIMPLSVLLLKFILLKYCE